jgi:cytochrome c553
MKNFIWVLVLALFLVPAFGGEPPQQGKGADLTWAFPVADKNIPPGDPDSVVRKLPGSTKTYTQGQIDDLFNPPDWFPEEHAPMPRVVQHGSGTIALGCASCHLASGLGHPESANLTGLSASYIQRQLSDFKSGLRTDARKRMSSFAQSLSEEDIKQAAEWFASLKPIPRDRVVEADTVPKSYVTEGTRRYAWPDGGTEPLGHRIIELPQDPLRITIRDPHSGFTDYVPVGSIARGEELVTTGGSGKTIACTICHGPSLTGLGEVPRIAGHDPIYIVRQLYGFQNGARNSSMAELMKAVVARLDGDDIIAIAAYVASRAPNSQEGQPTSTSATVPSAAAPK